MDEEFNIQAYHYDQGDFSSYQSDTVDPSPWALLLTLAFCITLILLLPLAVALRQSKQPKQPHTVATPPPPPPTPLTTINNNTHTSIILRQESNTELISFPIPRRKSQGSSHGLDNPFCHVEEDSTFNRLFDGNDDDDDDDDDDKSLYGLGTEVKEEDSKSDLWEDDPLPNSRTNIGGDFRKAKGFATLVQRAFRVQSKPSKSTTTTTTSPTQTTESQTNYVSMATVVTPLPVLVDDEDDEDDNPLSYSSSDSDEDRGYIIQMLMDDFDRFNGMGDSLESTTTTSTPKTNANHLGTTTTTLPRPSTQQLRKETGHGSKTTTTTTTKRSNHQKYHIDLCYGKRPWYGYYLSKGFFRKLYKCASWDDEMNKIAGLVIPYTLHAAVTHVFELMEIVVIGQLIAGTNAQLLGSYLAVDFILAITTMVGNGLLHTSVTVLCSHAVKARNLELAGKYVQLALAGHQLCLLPMIVVFWNHMDKVVVWLGFDPEEADEANEYGRMAFLAVAVNAYNTALHHVLDVAGFEWYSSVMDMIRSFASLAGVFAVGWLVIDAPLWTVGGIHLTVAIVFGLVNVSIVVWKQWLVGFWIGFRSLALGDRRAVKTFLKTAGPLCLGYVVEYCKWEILFVFAAAQGPAEMAVWGLLGYVWEFSEHIGAAIADAAEVRVAHLLASQHPALARYSSHKSLLLGVTTSLSMAMVILAVRNHLPAWLTMDETLQKMLTDLLPLVCAGLAALTFGSMSWTILCAQGRIRLATAMTFLGSFFVTLPLAVVSTFVLHWNLQGLLASLVIGHALSGIVNSFIMVTSKWETITEKASKRNIKKPKPKPKQTKQAKTELKSKSTESTNHTIGQSVEVELSQTQATTTTTTTTMHNNILKTSADTTDEADDVDDGSESSYEDYHWDELPPKVQEAAKRLGFTKRKWNHAMPTKYHKCEWNQLTSEQQDSALILGYNEARWNGWDNGMGDC